MTSPYEDLPVSEWELQTKKLIEQHPLSITEIKSVVLAVWDDVFQSGIGSKPFRIGVDLFPRPQLMAFFLHELIPLELSYRNPGIWRREIATDEKDIVHVTNPLFSIEIKTSSDPKKIFGNRSFAQKSETVKKSKNGYYLAINFEAFRKDAEIYRVGKLPRIVQIRFGWLDMTDWIGQTSATGQQARLSPDADRYKLLRIPL